MGTETMSKKIADLQARIHDLEINLDIANNMRRDAIEALEAFRQFDGNEDLWAAMKRERDEALKEVDKLRRILAHVPGKIAIKAKEDAGFPNFVHTAGTTK